MSDETYEELEAERLFLLTRIKAEKSGPLTGPRWFGKAADAVLFYVFWDEEPKAYDLPTSKYEYEGCEELVARLPDHLQDKAMPLLEDFKEHYLAKEEHYDRNRVINSKVELSPKP